MGTLHPDKIERLRQKSLAFLVADDEMFLRNLVRQMLRPIAPSHVDLVADGHEALRKLGHAPDPAGAETGNVPNLSRYPDCVITDFEMPEIDGLTLLRRIRAGHTGVRHDIPVILLTGHSQENLICKALELNVSGFVAKPVSSFGLLNRLYHAVAGTTDSKPASATRATESDMINQARKIA